MNLEKFFRVKSYINFIRNKIRENYKISYSQCGEDLIVDFIFTSMLSKPNPTYLDLGAHHPQKINNTFLFYRNGSHGVCVEPDPFLFKKIQRERRRDLCLNVGVGISYTTEADFYIIKNSRALNTFSKEGAEKSGEEIEKIIKIPLLTINDIINTYCKKTPDFISIDIEGLDLEIIQTLNFEKYRPKVICIETIEYSTQQKTNTIADFLKSKGYFVYADTYINTIFVDQLLWKM